LRVPNTLRKLFTLTNCWYAARCCAFPSFVGARIRAIASDPGAPHLMWFRCARGLPGYAFILRARDYWAGSLPPATNWDRGCPHPRRCPCRGIVLFIVVFVRATSRMKCLSVHLHFPKAPPSDSQFGTVLAGRLTDGSFCVHLHFPKAPPSDSRSGTLVAGSQHPPQIIHTDHMFTCGSLLRFPLSRVAGSGREYEL